MARTAVTVSEFRVGSVLGRGFSILFSNIVPFGLLSLLVMSPPYIYALAVDPQIYLEETEFSAFGSGIDIVESLLSYFLAAALVYGTFQELRGRHAGLDACISRGLALIFPVIGVTILAGLAVGLASILLVIPGLIVMTMLWVAIPAAVIEKPGVIGSLSRSADLTKGYRWQIFGIIVILTVVTLVAAFAIAFAIIVSDAGPTILVLGNLIITAFFTALGAVISAVGYHDLRVVKEGVGIEEIAAVFD